MQVVISTTLCLECLFGLCFGTLKGTSLVWSGLNGREEPLVFEVPFGIVFGHTKRHLSCLVLSCPLLPGGSFPGQSPLISQAIPLRHDPN